MRYLWELVSWQRVNLSRFAEGQWKNSTRGHF
jgi:hypothetical protein